MSGQVRGGAAPVARYVVEGDNCRQGGANLRFGTLSDVAFPVLSPATGAASVGRGHLGEECIIEERDMWSAVGDPPGDLTGDVPGELPALFE